jgi:hypothetical protein
VAIRSVCADYFMDFAFVRATDAERAANACATCSGSWDRRMPAGITRVVLPFVDQSAIRDDADREAVVDTALRRALPTADKRRTSSCTSSRLYRTRWSSLTLLAALPAPAGEGQLRFGQQLVARLQARRRIRRLSARAWEASTSRTAFSTAPRSLWDTETPTSKACSPALRRVDYTGDIVLQVARGTAGGEVHWAQMESRVCRELPG